MIHDDGNIPEIIRVGRGETVFVQGDHGDSAFLLEAGRITIRQVIDGRALELDAVEPGEIFGEMAVLDGGRRLATATAAQDSVVARLRASGFRHRLEGADRFLRALVMMVIKNIRSSHRVFLRRPRSFRDHVRQMNALSLNVRRFAARLPADEGGGRLVEVLDRLDAALGDLADLASVCRDQRQDIVLDTDEAEGVGLDQVVGSEARRRVYAPAKANA